MLNFKINEASCTQCGLCAKECPMLIIDGKKGIPEIKVGKEKNCIRCQHCLAVCPSGALSIFGKEAKNSVKTSDPMPDAEELSRLIKTRRSIRKFKKETLDSTCIEQLLEAAAYAPTGHNKNEVLLSVTYTQEERNKVRELIYSALKKASDAGSIKPDQAIFNRFQAIWHDKGIDVIFRDAPHIIFASAPESNSNGQSDSVIALSYLELQANAMGIGTLWNGFVKMIMTDIAPELKNQLGIPAEHAIGYVMVLGYPGVKYARGIQSEGLNLNRIKL
ncbi:MULTISPECIES: nitroreductase family protein [unclassified Carboxylicivirga]|uniref:nitroreductase family protein n=1 Tax=Carboxylicivirga TaxID=1628153 RepID=UPI003D3497F1